MRSLWLITAALFTSCVGGRSELDEIENSRAAPDHGADASAASDGLTEATGSESPDSSDGAELDATGMPLGAEASGGADAMGVDTSEGPSGEGSGGSDATGAGSGGGGSGGSNAAGAGGPGGSPETGTPGNGGGHGGFGGAGNDAGSGAACGSELEECNAECIDVSADRSHCGSCDAACDPGEVCESGSCVAPRPVRLVQSEDDRAAVSVALGGDVAVVGTDGDDNGYNTGAAYVFARSGATWVEQQKLLPSDSTEYNYFGDSVAVSGDTIVVGASLGQGHSVRSSAYVFVRNASGWTEQQKLMLPDGEVGYSVAVSGDTVIMGAPNAGSGSAHVFVRSGATWTEQQTLATSDPTGDEFGFSVAVSGDTALVGARRAAGREEDLFEAGAAYVFERSGSTWVEQQKLTASDGAITNHLGYTVALSGDTAVVSPYWDQENDGRGATYVFRRSDSTWTEEQKLLASDGAVEDSFGIAVATSGNVVLVGAPGDDPPEGANDGVAVGSAYVFVRTGSSWTEQHKIVSLANRYTEGGSAVGRSVAVSGDTALILTKGWVYSVELGVDGL